MSWASCATLLSTLMYLSFMFFRAKWMGRVASIAAGCAALFFLLELAFKVRDMLRLSAPVIGLLNSMPEVTALFCAIAVIHYLIIERFYRSKNAGWFVMSIISVVILIQTTFVNKI
jgi:hypothetical protein